MSMKSSTASSGASGNIAARRRLVVLGAVGWMSVGLARSSPLSRPAATPESASTTAGDTAEGMRRANVCSASNPTGVGLRGEYFSAPSRQGKPGLVRIDRTIEFGSLSEVASETGATPGSILWTGWIKAPVSGHYRFDGGSPRVRITVANIPVAGEGAAIDAGADLSVGKFYSIRVELDRVESGLFPLRLMWTTPYGARYGVPRQLLFLPTDTVGGTS